MANSAREYYGPNDPQWVYAQQQAALQQHQPGVDFSYPTTSTAYNHYTEFFPQYPQERTQYQQYPAQSVPPAYPASSAAEPSVSGHKRRRVERQQSGQSEPAAHDATYDTDATGSGRSKVARPSGACKHCKRLKMRCEFPVDEDGEPEESCLRCRTSGHDCVLEGRKPRSAPNKRQYLEAQLDQKDAMIESLLKQLHNPYTATPLSIASYRRGGRPADNHPNSLVTFCDGLRATGSGKGKGKSSVPTQVSSATLSSADLPDDDGAQAEQVSVDDDATTLPDESVPIGLLANLGLSTDKGRKPARPPQEDELDDDNVGVANASYFRPGPSTNLSRRTQLIKDHSPPEIVMHGLVTPEDVEELFELFYARINPFIALLDPELHTPESTFARCPFLFTVVCAIASRYHPDKSKAEIYPMAMHFAKNAAASALIDGWKSVEMCQAYILMSVYATPTRSWDEDRSALYAGMAIRLAMDLGLHEVSPPRANEGAERERLNRARVWMSCFIVDRSLAIQSGKPSTIKEDYVLRLGGDDWYKMSPLRNSYDVHISAYASLLRLVSTFREDVFSDPIAPTGLNRRIDLHGLTLTYNDNLTRLAADWTRRFEQDSDANDDKCAFRCKLFTFMVAYSRLAMFSVGFHKGADMRFLPQCLESAKSVVRCMMDELTPSGCMQCAPDDYFANAAFAAGLLLKLLRPEFAHLRGPDEVKNVLGLVSRLIETLSASDIVVDNRHAPKLYAVFLARLLATHRADGTSVGTMETGSPPATQAATSSSRLANGSVPGPFTAKTRDNALPQQSGHGYGLPAYPHAYRAGPTLSAENILAAVGALKTPEWWNGFSWPESEPSSCSPQSSAATSSSVSPYESEQPLPPLRGFPLELGQFVR